MVPSHRESREISQGRFLAAHDPEFIWGWNTVAGRLRAERRAALIAAGAGLGPGVRCLEIGCGTGLFTEHFASSGAHIIAVDISYELLDMARERGLDPEQVRFLEKSFDSSDMEGPFDAVIGSSILHHLDIEPAVKRIFHLLKPGGVMSFAEPNMLNPQIFFQKNIPWLKARLGDSPDETAFVRWPLRRLLRREGFKPVAIQPFDWLHPQIPETFISKMKRLSILFESMRGLREFSGSLLIRARRPM